MGITKNRTSLVSNEIMEVNRYKLTLNAQKLLFGLAQLIDHTIDLFPEIQIDIDGICDYLGISNRSDKYGVIRDALFNITENPLQKKVSDDEWYSIPWMSVHFKKSDSKFVKIKFHDDVKPYLLKLREYTKIKGLYISKLTSQYATWLYPVMKMIQTKYYGKHAISIERLKEYTFTDNPKEHPAYNTSSNANNNFLRRILGLVKNTKTKKIEILENSPLWEINEKTDISIIIELKKTGRKYTDVMFFVSSKTAKKKQLKQAPEKSQYVSEIPKKNIAGGMRLDLKTVYAHANASNMGVHEYCEKAGYYIKGNYVYKRLTEHEYNQYMKAQNKENNKRTFTQSSIFDIINKKN